MATNTLKSLAAGFTALGLVATGPLTGNAIAEDARATTRTVSYQPVNFVENARTEAREWAGKNPNDIVFSVYYGTEADLKPDRIQRRLLEVSDEHGCYGDAKVFFEQTSSPGTVFDVRYAGLYEANLNIREVIPFTRDEAGPHKCTENNLVLASFD